MEMNQFMYDNWKSIITPDSYIFMLGDFVCGTKRYDLDKNEAAQQLYDVLPGRKIFILGNHDNNMVKGTNIPAIEGPIEVIYKNKRILLNHEPIYESFEQDLLVHGHVHDAKRFHYESNKFNVSCEAINYMPILIDDILEKFDNDKIK
jgi:calcineurin-like phosphoesterase family protein